MKNCNETQPFLSLAQTTVTGMVQISKVATSMQSAKGAFVRSAAIGVSKMLRHCSYVRFDGLHCGI